MTKRKHESEDEMFTADVMASIEKSEAEAHKKTKHPKAAHPGQVLLEEFMKPKGWTTKDLSTVTRYPEDAFIQLVAGKTPMTQDMAERLSRALGTEQVYWMGLQKAYDA